MAFVSKIAFEDILGKVASAAWERKDTEFLESFRPNQIRSKTILVNKIMECGIRRFDRVAVLGAWNGLLLYELMQDHVGHWDFYDLSENVAWDRKRYFEINQMDQNYNDITGNAVKMFKHTNMAESYDLVINPSCEHMDDIPAIPGPLYALTSNNYVQVAEHINTIERSEDLAIKNNINNILHSGRIKIQRPVPYERYYTIGYA